MGLVEGCRPRAWGEGEKTDGAGKVKEPALDSSEFPSSCTTEKQINSYLKSIQM